jgi:hypothetical protein
MTLPLLAPDLSGTLGASALAMKISGSECGGTLGRASEVRDAAHLHERDSSILSPAEMIRSAFLIAVAYIAIRSQSFRQYCRSSLMMWQIDHSFRCRYLLIAT